MLRSLPFVAIVVVAITDVLAGPRLGFLPLLTLGPTFASVSGSVRRTAIVGTLAVGVCLPLAQYNGLLGKAQNNLTIATIVGVTGASMVASHLRIRRERELANVRIVAEAAQRVLLRPVPRRAGDLRIALSYTSAAAEAQIGGDLYEVVVTTANGVRLLIGDVQGKGLAAVETAAWVLGAFREAAYDEPDLSGLGDRLETSLARHLDAEQFVTAILAEVHEDEITLLNFGHPAPLLLTGDGQISEVDLPNEGVPLGLGGLGAGVPKPYQVPFGQGDQILFYTDGVIEARDDGGAFYPLLARADILQCVDPQAALDDLRADLLDHVGGPLPDDAAMLLLQRQAA
ncbi:PP2C family protein-serine/threonine phosphatase [Nonomuraea sp. NPDC046570]|uniref:PP2C family protein-serine/threonine phosphatase n=1 Tax=Nonomuraea sp. NPDC046570 TaxID=3155255 RepID=UPI0033DBDD0B